MAAKRLTATLNCELWILASHRLHPDSPKNPSICPSPLLIQRITWRICVAVDFFKNDVYTLCLRSKCASWYQRPRRQARSGRVDRPFRVPWLVLQWVGFRGFAVLIERTDHQPSEQEQILLVKTPGSQHRSPDSSVPQYKSRGLKKANFFCCEG